jgi:IMP dehydrogenase
MDNIANTFDDVLIKPRFSKIASRADVDLSFNGDGFPYMELPIISANMDTITGSDMAHAMIFGGGQACLHRFSSIEENVQQFLDARLVATGECRIPMVSVGLGNKELDRARALFGAGAFTFIVDVAHGASMGVVQQVRALREIFNDRIAVVVGNFATGESVKDFLEICPEVDGFKVGIGPGSLCTTRIKTGVGFPQLSAIMEISQVLKRTGIPVIADGGMKTPGDCAKALGAGASMLMIGSMLAGTEESPGETQYLHKSGKTFKLEDFPVSVDYSYFSKELQQEFQSKIPKVKKYRGSASQESYEAQGKTGSHRTAEGESTFVPYKGAVKDILQDIEGGLRSAFSYVGACNLKEFHDKVEFVKVSNATKIENSAHLIK